MGKHHEPENAAATNRKARHKFEILETFETGIELKGSEVKSLRERNISIEEAYARIYNGQLTLIGCQIAQYKNGAYANHEPARPRRLLMHRREIRKLEARVIQRGLTMVPLKVYFNERGWAKVLLGLARGRNQRDKREELKRKVQNREMDRERARMRRR